jgi:hypothetical protein
VEYLFETAEKAFQWFSDTVTDCKWDGDIIYEVIVDKEENFAYAITCDTTTHTIITIEFGEV